MAQRDHRLDDRAGRAGRAEGSDKGAIDLEPVERKFLQVAQARKAGAEIVDRNADAERAQRFEPFQSFLRVVDQDAFGHFKDDARRGNAGVRHRRADQIDQPAVANLHRGKIDGDRQIRPAGAVGQRPPQHDLAELRHQAALFCERNEHRRRNWTAVRMVPAQQSFDTDDRAAVGRNDRLIVDVKSLQRDRRLQFAQQRSPLGVFGFDLRLEKSHSAAAFPFGRAQRETGTASHFISAGSVLGGFSNADPGRELPHPVNEDRAMERGAQCIDQHGRGVFILAADHDREFIFLEASQNRSVRQSGLQMFADIHDHGVAAGPPQRVVDFVKAVEVDDSEYHDAGTTPRYRSAETLDHGALVGQPRQISCSTSLRAASAPRSSERSRCRDARMARKPTAPSATPMAPKRPQSRFIARTSALSAIQLNQPMIRPRPSCTDCSSAPAIVDRLGIEPQFPKAGAALYQPHERIVDVLEIAGVAAHFLQRAPQSSVLLGFETIFARAVSRQNRLQRKGSSRRQTVPAGTA